MKTVTDETFFYEVLDSDQPVVVDFWATWCNPCRQVAKVLETLEAENPHIKFVKMDVDENPVAAKRWGVTSVPTMQLFHNGKLQREVIGAKPKVVLQRELISV